MKLTCTWSPEQLSVFFTFHCFFWPFPLLPRVPRINSVQTRLTEARNRHKARRCQSRQTDVWFIFHLLGNATIWNDHFGTLGRQKKNDKNTATGQIRRQATGKRPGAPNDQSAPVPIHIHLYIFAHVHSFINACIYLSFCCTILAQTPSYKSSFLSKK